MLILLLVGRAYLLGGSGDLVSRLVMGITGVIICYLTLNPKTLNPKTLNLKP